MSLLIMAVYDTEENGRSEYTNQTLLSLWNTVDFFKHRLIIVNNGSCEKTVKSINHFKNSIKDCDIQIITNIENLGTAKAINQGLKLRQPNEYCIKIDNDVVINQSGWADEMEEAIERDPTIGIVGLKRKDVDWDGQYISLTHEPGQRWITVEKGTYIMGTCTMFNHLLLDKIGYMRQPGVYGLDDTLFSLRSELAGFYNCYLPHIDIDHIDRGDNSYVGVKQRQAGDTWDIYMNWHQGYIDGTRPLWEDFE